MPGKVVIVGATGQIGRQIVRTFVAAGWRVTAMQRGATTALPDHPAITAITVDRDRPGALEAAVGSGADVLVDVIASTATHARQLIGLQSRVGRLAVLSSASVYCDDCGRTLAESGFADLPIPVAETHRTIAPGDHGYSARKAAMEQTLLQAAKVPLAIIRPAAVYGPGSVAPREWWFLKRLLDGRPVVPLAFGGESRFHTVATANAAELIRVAVECRGTYILNAADPVALTSSEIGMAIAAAVGRALRIEPLAGPPVDGVGASPWSLPHPFVADMSAAKAIGYRPVTTYEDFVRSTCDWLVAAARERPWQEAFADLAPRAASLFDYAREDSVLGANRRSTSA